MIRLKHFRLTSFMKWNINKEWWVADGLSCHEKTTVPSTFGRTCTRLEIEYFQLFSTTFDFFPCKFAACSKPSSRNNHCKASYSRTKQRDQCAWLNPNPAIGIVVRTTPLLYRPRSADAFTLKSTVHKKTIQIFRIQKTIQIFFEFFEIWIKEVLIGC